jgi:hypothetical protein
LVALNAANVRVIFVSNIPLLEVIAASAPGLMGSEA